LSSGGREKAPAAFCRKTLTSKDQFEMWGDGLQTRSFTFIDECVEGVLRYALLILWLMTVISEIMTYRVSHILKFEL